MTLAAEQALEVLAKAYIQFWTETEFKLRTRIMVIFERPMLCIAVAVRLLQDTSLEDNVLKIRTRACVTREFLRMAFMDLTVDQVKFITMYAPREAVAYLIDDITTSLPLYYSVKVARLKHGFDCAYRRGPLLRLLTHIGDIKKTKRKCK
jgi:hypothetical protein